LIKSREIKIVALREDFFCPYGRILEPAGNESPEVDEPDNFKFYVPFKEFSQGWQIGYLINFSKKLKQLERHPNTAEVFSPITGDTLLVVSENPEDPQTLKGFKLEKPIVFNRGVWHGVISLGEKSEVLIVESPDVVDEFFQLQQSVTAPQV
jgi:ureidoglycolate hydrolase